jgi:hypothetical protein
MLLKETGVLLPYLIALVGVLSDYLTTNIGLGMGFTETNLSYNPVYALSIFWSILTLLKLTLPNNRLGNITKNVLASVPFLGALNNTLVITGLISGLAR